MTWPPEPEMGGGEEMGWGEEVRGKWIRAGVGSSVGPSPPFLFLSPTCNYPPKLPLSPPSPLPSHLGVSDGVSHDVLPVGVHLFEQLPLLRHLSHDVLRREDGLQIQPL